ncbi:MAG: metallophosphoesterase family protein [Deltaproteobacteria bacterium]|nr:metallophosphoesterase family protein [Deltaproteobacteria bacterium]
MRIAILSDTHVGPSRVREVLDSVAPHLEGADRILHAGDIVCSELLDGLRRFAPVDAVAGNMDGEALHSILPERTELELAGKRVGLIHGWGAPNDLARRVWERFTGPDGLPTVDAIVFGHSHRPLVDRHRGVLMVNPGSATDTRWAPRRSMAVMRMQDGALDARIIDL